MKFQMGALKDRIISRFGSIRAFAAEMGISPPTVSSWLNNDTDISLPNIRKAAALLEIPGNEIEYYFWRE